MKVLLVAIALMGSAVSGQSDTGRAVKIHFSNPGLIPAQWTLELHPDGSAHFRTERGNAPRTEATEIEAPDLDRDVQLSPRFAQRVFEVARRKKLFREQCESHLNVAFQGMKTLTYSGPDGQGSCAFNYAKDVEIESLGDSLVSVATTLIEGARLEMLLRHDPLGLDRETESLLEMAADGRVREIGSIRGILEQLAGNDEVLDRVRKRARELLSQAND